MTYSEVIADFVNQVNFSDLSPAIVEIVKKCMLDAIGNALFGFNTPWASSVTGFVREEGGSQEATVINCPEKVPSANAAFANGTMMHSFDFDDAGEHGGHPGAVIIPAALSVAEKLGANGRDIVESVVIGYEIKNRLLKAVDPLPEKNHYARGFHPTGTCGTFASAVVAGKLLSSTREEICNSLGVAGSFAAGSLEWLSDGSMTKRFHPGKAAHDGIVSAILARKGLTGPRSIFEGKYGFLKAYSDITEPQKLIDRLGSPPFEIEKTVFKLNAACLAAHSSLDGILEIMRENNLEAKDVERITIGIRKSHYRLIAEPQSTIYTPTTVLQAQMSLPYCAAFVALHGRAILPTDLDEKSIKDANILRFAKKVQPVLDAKLEEKEYYDKRPAKVELTTSDGRKIKKEIAFPRGDPRNPVPLSVLQEKFSNLASPVIGSEKVLRIVEAVRALDKMDDLTELGNLLRPTK